MAAALAVAPAALAAAGPAGAGAPGTVSSPAAARDTGAAPPGNLMQVVYGKATAGPRGYSPVTIQRYYHFNAMGKDANGNPVNGSGQTIAVVLWGNYPEAAADLRAFIARFKLPPMLGLNGTSCKPSAYAAEPCFEVADAGGKVPNPSSGSPKNPGTDGEYAMDIEWAHVAAPGANIVMVQGQATLRFNGQWYATVPEVDQAIQAAENSGASVVSMSFGSPAMTAAQAATWDQASVALVSGEGDDGYPDTEYPPADTNVLSVGGTNITPSGEQAWVDTGGGDTSLPRPGYQINWTSSTVREVNDVAYNAAGRNSARPLYYSVALKFSATGPMQWIQEGGVSAGIPQWAGIIADTDQYRYTLGKSILASSGVMSGLYLAASDTGKLPPGVIDQAYFKDITTGCAYAYSRKTPPKPPCVIDAAKGFDTLTGLGTPDVGDLVSYLSTDL
jgi:subtilase family serine protease